MKEISKKNFILEDPTIENEEEREIMILGKQGGDNFRIDIRYPLNSYVGMGIVLSAFNSKIGC